MISTFKAALLFLSGKKKIDKRSQKNRKLLSKPKKTSWYLARKLDIKLFFFKAFILYPDVSRRGIIVSENVPRFLCLSCLSSITSRDLPASAGTSGDVGSVPGLGRSPGGGHGNPLQCSCLENPMDRGAWWATVHGVTKELDMTQQVNKKKSLEKQHFWLVQLSAPISGSILGTKQILLTVVETTPILTSLLTGSNIKELAMTAVFHMGTSMYTRLQCQLSPGKWVLLDFRYLDIAFWIARAVWKGTFALYFSFLSFWAKESPISNTQKILPRRQKLFIKMDLDPALKNVRTMIACNRVRFLLGLSVLKIRHLIFWKKSEINNVDIQHGASSPKFITEIPFTPIRARWGTGQNSWAVWGSL